MASKASARRLRRKAHNARVQAVDAERYNAWHGLQIAAQPLPSTLVPVAEWGKGWQRFAALPTEGSKVRLCVRTKHGTRGVGHAPFATWQQAMAYTLNH